MLTTLSYTQRIGLGFLIFLLSGAVYLLTYEWWYLLLPLLYLVVPLALTNLVHTPAKLYLLLWMVLPLSTELNITPALGIDFPDEILMLLLTGMALLLWCHRPYTFPVAVSRHPLFTLILLHVTWIGISTVFAEDKLPAFKFLLAKCWYIFPFAILPSVWLHTPLQITRWAKYVLLSMGAVVAITMIRHGGSGFGFASINKHLFPFFRNHVNYAAMLVCLLPVLWAVWYLWPRYRKGRSWILLALVLTLLALLFAYSRGAWLALLTGGAAVWIIRKKWMAMVAVLLTGAVLVSVVWLVTDQRYFKLAPDHDRTIFHTDFTEHLSATVSGKDVSNAERFYRWVAGAKMFAERPVTGFGPASFYHHYRPYTVKRFETWVSNNPEHSTVHNYYLLTALEQGLPGLLIFCGMILFALMRLQRCYHCLLSVFHRTVALVTAVVLVMILTINASSDMVETDKIGSLFWLCLGMTMVLDNYAEQERSALA
ncbi:MAG: O-antigen ligase family protein [Chitinophagaceae bacterium]|nr:O-antigen ligase family protein [Chitinophagaceae bacterium]